MASVNQRNESLFTLAIFWSSFIMMGQTYKTGSVRIALFGVAALVALTGYARADEREHHEEGREHHEEGREHHEDAREHHEIIGRDRQVFHERDVHRFNEVEMGRWRGGQWRNSCFAGRCGWWWFAGGQWYFYDRPIYPYPLIVSEYAYVEPGAPVYAVPPPAVYVAPAPGYPPPQPQAAPPPATPQVYYYCDNPAGYYPYVQSCPSQFRPVPAPPR
jgi:hypothetical protein